MFRDVRTNTFTGVTLDELTEVARNVLEEARENKVWLFSGEMGAGKTTLIKVLCRHLGVIDSMSSPTFSIVNEYATSDQHRVFHFDFFRIRNENEAQEIGTEEYFYSGDYCFIEWPEKISGLIPLKHARIRIEFETETRRTISLSVT
jgi:tRNA threonylcarbamoyladenosine biosynthesis protein TsaE